MSGQLPDDVAAALAELAVLLEGDAWDNSRSHVGDRVRVEVIHDPPPSIAHQEAHTEGTD